MTAVMRLSLAAALLLALVVSSTGCKKAGPCDASKRGSPREAHQAVGETLESWDVAVFCECLTKASLDSLVVLVAVLSGDEEWLEEYTDTVPVPQIEAINAQHGLDRASMFKQMQEWPTQQKATPAQLSALVKDVLDKPKYVAEIVAALERLTGGDSKQWFAITFSEAQSQYKPGGGVANLVLENGKRWQYKFEDRSWSLNEMFFVAEPAK